MAKKSKDFCLAQEVHKTQVAGSGRIILGNPCHVPGMFFPRNKLLPRRENWARGIFSPIQSSYSKESNVCFTLQSTTVRSWIHSQPFSSLLWKMGTWIGGILLHCNDKALCLLINQKSVNKLYKKEKQTINRLLLWHWGITVDKQPLTSTLAVLIQTYETCSPFCHTIPFLQLTSDPRFPLPLHIFEKVLFSGGQCVQT